MANLAAFRSAIRASRATLTASRSFRRSTAAGLGRRLRSGCPFKLGLLRICGCAQAVSKTGVLGPVDFSLLRSRKRLLAQGIDGFRSALATPYSRKWTRPRLKSSRACRGGSLRRSSARLSDGVTTFVERCRLRSAEFPVALLLQSQNPTTERRLIRANYVAGCVSKICENI